MYFTLCVLGSGSFCTTLLATATPLEGSDPDIEPTLVVLKKKKIAASESHPVIEQMETELNALRQLSNLSCDYLPRIYGNVVNGLTIADGVEFIPMLPVGQSLETRCALLTPQKRLTEALVLYQHITAGLRAAHTLQLCPRDMRPDNVVYDQTKSCYVVIDWGLADFPGAIMHQHRGGRAYCHDAIVDAMNHLNRIPFRPEHDLEAARYIAYVFSRGPSFDTSSWDRLSRSFIPTRARIVGEFCA